MTPIEWAIEEKNLRMLYLLGKSGAKIPKKLVFTIKRRFGKAVLEGAEIV
jgi:hypothetical protein